MGGGILSARQDDFQGEDETVSQQYSDSRETVCSFGLADLCRQSITRKH